jgi:hypothetical protein
MLEDFFIIPLAKIDDNWLVHDLNYEFFALEYCEEVLDIPLQYIDDVDYSEDGLEIGLKNIANKLELASEDWYIQLRRLSSYARAS